MHFIVMRKIYSILFLGFLLFISLSGYAQEEVADYTHLEENDYNGIKLPTLDVLFENARQSPYYELATVKTQIERKVLAKEKRGFLGFFSIRGSYQYGMFGNESTYTDVSIPPYLSYATQAQKGYTIGGAVNIPLDQLFDLGGRVKRQKLILKSAELEREIKHEELKKDIIGLYTTATSQLSVLKQRSETLVLAKLQYEMAEKDFINGAIKSTELSDQKSRYMQAFENLQNTKAEALKSIMLLELASHTQILNR